jgi:hypothetical protein
VHQVGSSIARPLASMLKLFVLGALAHQIAAGRVSWTQQLTVTAALKTGGSGSLQDVPAGTRLSVQQTAAMMISISDNTAADMLIHLVGRSAVQAQDRQWSDHAALNVPFLTTRELFLLKYVHPALASRYLSPPPGRRAAFPASSVDPLPFSPARAQSLATASPTDIETLEWFASPGDVCSPPPDCSSSRPSQGWHPSAPSCRPTTAHRTWPGAVAHRLVQRRLRTRSADPGLSGHEQQRPDLRGDRDAR